MLAFAVGFTTPPTASAVPPEVAEEMEQRMNAVRNRGQELRRAFEQQREAMEAIARLNAAASEDNPPDGRGGDSGVRRRAMEQSADALRRMFDELERVQREVEEQFRRERSEPINKAAEGSGRERSSKEAGGDGGRREDGERGQDEHSPREFEAQQREHELQLLRLEIARSEVELEMMHRELHSGSLDVPLELLKIIEDADPEFAIAFLEEAAEVVESEALLDRIRLQLVKAYAAADQTEKARRTAVELLRGR